MISYMSAFVTLVFCSISLWFAPRELAKNHPGDVRIVWYFFSLTAVMTSLLAIWAISYNVIDDNGVFLGRAGQILSFLISISLGIEGSIKLGLGILALVAAPQVLSYILSGLSGSSSAPIFVTFATEVAIWFAVKALIVAAGVVIPYVGFAYFGGWSGATLEVSLGLLTLSAMLLATAFGMLCIYRDFSTLSSYALEKSPTSLKRFIQRIHAFATRNQRHSDQVATPCLSCGELSLSREEIVAVLKVLTVVGDHLSRKLPADK